MEKETVKSDNKEDQGRNQEWIKVTRRHRGSKKVVYDEHSPQHNYNHVVKKGLLDFDKVMRDKAISFFFTNFPETWYFAALWKMFNRYGRVVDVYIAFKQTKRGTRFGLVRFINIGDVASFEGRLKGILIRNSKLVINRAKFIKVRDMGVPASDFPPFNPGKQHIPKASKPHANPSFKEAVLGRLGTSMSSRTSGLLSAWLLIKGLPPLGRDYNSVKNITKESDHILEVGRLDFDSKLLFPIKSLVLLPDMNVASQSLMVLLNGKYFPIRVFKEPFQASCLLSPPSDSDDASIFEEEFIGPSMDRDSLDVDLFGDSSSEIGPASDLHRKAIAYRRGVHWTFIERR
ncbi:nucleotide-binding alpha-beta plait domain-containing protein [Tanacetum coccineum]